MFNLFAIAKAFLISLAAGMIKSFSTRSIPFSSKSVGIIGGADGPTSIFVSGNFGSLGFLRFGISNVSLLFGFVWLVFSAAVTFILVYNLVKKYK